MEKVTICYNSSAVCLKSRIDEVNEMILSIADDWEFTAQQIKTNFTEKDNFFIRLNMLDDFETASGLLAFAQNVIKSMNRFILSSEVNFVCIC